VGLLERDHVRLLGRRLGLRRALHRGARELGYDLVKRHYYSEVPDLDSLPAGIWSARSELSGIDFDVAAGLRFVREELGAAMAEFDAPQHSRGDPAEFYFQNTFYEGLDAETLYAMVRRYRPRRVLELGSGMSTLVIARARERNGLRPGDRHDVFDPFSRPELRDALRSACELHPVSATEVPAAAFAQLAAGDLLFVDTTHTVKIGSDVNHIVLRVLPLLAPGVLVHFHDICLPYEYPRYLLEDYALYWAEQYLLQAFLSMNPSYEVRYAADALCRDRRAQVEAAGLAGPSESGSSFWIRRR
jgi:hypothetical protein